MMPTKLTTQELLLMREEVAKQRMAAWNAATPTPSKNRTAVKALVNDATDGQLGTTADAQSAMAQALANPSDMLDLGRLQGKRQEIRARPAGTPGVTSGWGVAGNLLSQGVKHNDLRQNTKAQDAVYAKQRAVNDAQIVTRAEFMRNNPQFANTLSDDPRMQAVGAQQQELRQADALARRQQDAASLAHQRAQQAATTAHGRAVAKQTQNREATQAFTVAQNQLLNAGQIQTGLDKFQTKTQPIMQLGMKIQNLDGILSKYAKGGEFEGIDIPGIGGVQGMVGGTPKSGGGGALIAGGVGGAALTKGRFVGNDRDGHERVGTGLTGAGKLLAAGAGALGLSALAGAATPGRAGAAARLREGGAQEEFTAIQDMISQIVRTNAGLSQTQSELETVRNSMGVGNMSPEQAFLAAFPRIKKAYRADMDLIRKGTHGQVMDAYKGNYGGNDPTDIQFQDFSFPQLEKSRDKHLKKLKERKSRLDNPPQRPAGGGGATGTRQSSLRDDLEAALGGYV